MQTSKLLKLYVGLQGETEGDAELVILRTRDYVTKKRTADLVERKL